MLTCKQVSKALAEGDYLELSCFKRRMLQLHIMLCFICRGANRDIMTFQDLARAFRKKEESLPSSAKLPDDARQRIRAALKQ